MSASVMCVGMDVHKDSIVMAVVREGRAQTVTWKTLPYDGAKLCKNYSTVSPRLCLRRM